MLQKHDWMQSCTISNGFTSDFDLNVSGVVREQSKHPLGEDAGILSYPASGSIAYKNHNSGKQN
jgi:hypothetical protein